MKILTLLIPFLFSCASTFEEQQKDLKKRCRAKVVECELSYSYLYSSDENGNEIKIPLEPTYSIKKETPAEADLQKE